MLIAREKHEHCGHKETLTKALAFRCIYMLLMTQRHHATRMLWRTLFILLIEHSIHAEPSATYPVDQGRLGAPTEGVGVHEGAVVHKPAHSLDFGNNLLVSLLDIHARKVCDLCCQAPIVVHWDGKPMGLVRLTEDACTCQTGSR